MGSIRDEYTIAPLSLIRSREGRPVRVVLGAGAKHQWLENGNGSAVEADWSANGSTLDLYGPAGPLRVFAPSATVIRRNGAIAAATREGDFVRLP
jgi:hypothetical protein